MTRTFRIATVNCLHGLDVRAGPPGPVDRRLDALAERIGALDADVVALQEVDRGLERSHGVDQVAVLADALGYDGVFAPALHGDPDRSWSRVEDDDDPRTPAYGVGMLSRLAIVSRTRIALPGGGPGERPQPVAPPGPVAVAASMRPGWDREPRVALRVDLSLDGTRLAVTTTHLSYLPWRGLAQLRAAAASAAPGVPAAVLTGDLNLPAWLVRAVARRSGWRHARGGPTYPVERPRVQLDQVLVRGALAVERTGAGPATTSDHLPHVAELRLET